MGVSGAVRVIIRSISSLIGGLVSLNMTSGYLYPGSTSSLGPLSAFQNILPISAFQNLLGTQVTSVTGQLTSAGPLSSLGPLTHIFPFAAAGGGGFVVWMIVQKILGHAESLTYSRSMPKVDASSMMKNFGLNMPSFSAQASNIIPEKLPNDINKAQFMILKSFQQGYKKPKDIERQLSIDKKEVEKETAVLKTNGYLTKDNKLTSKGLEVLTQGR